MPVQAEGQHYRTGPDEPLSSIVARLNSGKYSSITLLGGTMLWVLDLKYWFPGIQVSFQALDTDDERLVTQLAALLIMLDEGAR
jgi:hypothetical protein